MFLKNMTHRERIMFYAAVIVIAGVVLYTAAIEPAYTKWNGITEEIAAKETQLIKNLKILSQEEIIDKLYDKYSANIKMKGSVEEETASILREVENIASMSSTYLADIKPLKVKDMDFYKEYYIELEAEGTISGLAKFIYDLQGSKQMLKVETLRLNPRGGRTGTLKGHIIITKILIP